MITEEQKLIGEYIESVWGKHFTVKLGLRLKDILPEPSNVGLNHIWKYGEADIAVYKKDKLISIIEPGGSQHFTNNQQIKNDRRKYKLCEINRVKCLHLVNGTKNVLSNRKFRNLIRTVMF